MTKPSMTLKAEEFEHGTVIPKEHTCEGSDRVPTLTWSDAPHDTASFALIVDDPDAPNGTFTHWVRYDIPVRGAGEPQGPEGGTDGKNDFETLGWRGPCPPPNHGDHRYFFKLFALDVDSLGVKEGATRDEVHEAMEGHVLKEAELMGIYAR